MAAASLMTASEAASIKGSFGSSGTKALISPRLASALPQPQLCLPPPW